MNHYDFHPLADLFPLLDGEQFDELVADIRTNGLREPIVVLDGQVLDGRNRYRACLAAGVEPRLNTFKGVDPVAFVISMNLRRRHMNASQRAAAAAKLETYRHGGGRKIQDANLHLDRAKAAELLNVSERTVAHAAKVSAEGTPELVKAVENGKLAVSAAARLTTESADVQHAIIADISAGEKPANVIRRHAMRVMSSSESDEYYTPPHIVALVAAFLGGVDLDPCWHPDSSVQAAATYTAADDGLSKSWFGRVYLNPPYGRAIDDWIAKLCTEHANGNVPEAIALVPAHTDTEWFRRLDSFPRCFVNGRLTFANSTTPAPFPSAIVYLGQRHDAFAEIFHVVGSTFVRLAEPHPLDIPPELRRAAS